MPKLKKVKAPPFSKIGPLIGDNLPIVTASVLSDGKIKVAVTEKNQFYIGQLVRVNGIWFYVHAVQLNQAILVPFKMHEQIEHDPLEKPSIKKDWVKAIVTAHEKEGATHEDIEFMADVFADTPVSENEVELVKLLPSEVGDPVTSVAEDYTSGMPLEEKPSLGEQVPGSGDQTGKSWGIPLDVDTLKVQLVSGGGGGSTAIPVHDLLKKLKTAKLTGLVSSTGKKAALPNPPPEGKTFHGSGLVLELPPKGVSMFSDIADPALKEIADQLDEYAMNSSITKAKKGVTELRIKAKKVPKGTEKDVIFLLCNVSKFSPNAVKVAISGKLWLPVIVKDLSEYATLISELETQGVEFAISEG